MYIGSTAAPEFLFALSTTAWANASDEQTSTSSVQPPCAALELLGAENGLYSGNTTGTAAQLLAQLLDPAAWATSDSRFLLLNQSFDVLTSGSDAGAGASGSGPALTAETLALAGGALAAALLGAAAYCYCLRERGGGSGEGAASSRCCKGAHVELQQVPASCGDEVLNPAHEQLGEDCKAKGLNRGQKTHLPVPTSAV